MFWLLDSDTAQRFDRFCASITPTADQLQAFAAQHATASKPTNLEIVGNEASIAISGVLTKSRSYYASLFGAGNSTYADIDAAVQAADSDPRVRSIQLVIDSPGGDVDGLFSTLATLQAVSKPMRAQIVNATSAAYAIAAQAQHIEAENAASLVGSIGVATRMFTSEDVHQIANTASPHKRPDPRTPEGLAAVRAELDAIHDLFAEAIAAGRKTTPEIVNASYGRGATLTAANGLKLGMVDSIAGRPNAKATSPARAEGTKSMDLSLLKAEHPAVYAAAVEVGINQERGRVKAHITLAEAAGDISLAVEHLRAGADCGQPEVQAHYMAAAIKRHEQTARTTEGQQAAAAVAGAAAPVVAAVENATLKAALDQHDARRAQIV